MPPKVSTLSALFLVFAMSTAYADTEHADKTEALRKEFEAAPAGSEAQKRAGQKICFQIVGPLAVAVWTPSGKLLCETLKR